MNMPTEIVQVRDVPSENMRKVRARAAVRNVSPSQYLRDLTHDDLSQPEMSAVLARIATRSSDEAATEEIQSFIEEQRQ